MSRGLVDKSGILTFRPRVVFVNRRKVVEGHQQEEYKEKGNLVSNSQAISTPEDEASNSRLLGKNKEMLQGSRKVSVNISRNLLKKETVVPGANRIKKVSLALSKEDTDFLQKGGQRVIKKIEEISDARIGRSGKGTKDERAFIQGSERAIMKAKRIINKEDMILNKEQVTFLMVDGRKRMKRIQKDSNALIIMKGKSNDYMRPVSFIGSDLAIAIAKAILVEATIIQTKIMLDSEVSFLLRCGGKYIERIQKEAEVLVKFQGKRGDKGQATDVIGSKEAVEKVWALIQKDLNKS